MVKKAMFKALFLDMAPKSPKGGLTNYQIIIKPPLGGRGQKKLVKSHAIYQFYTTSATINVLPPIKIISDNAAFFLACAKADLTSG